MDKWFVKNCDSTVIRLGTFDSKVLAGQGNIYSVDKQRFFLPFLYEAVRLIKECIMFYVFSQFSPIIFTIFIGIYCSSGNLTIPLMPTPNNNTKFKSDLLSNLFL